MGSGEGRHPGLVRHTSFIADYQVLFLHSSHCTHVQMGGHVTHSTTARRSVVTSTMALVPVLTVLSPDHRLRWGPLWQDLSQSHCGPWLSYMSIPPLSHPSTALRVQQSLSLLATTLYVGVSIGFNGGPHTTYMYMYTAT